MDHDNVTTIAKESVKWSVLVEIFIRIASSLILIILTWFVFPEDFGVISITSGVISFTLIFWETGLGRFIVQTEDDIEKVANSLFIISLILGLTVYSALYFIAPFFAEFYNNDILIPIIRFLGIQIVFSALSTVHYSMLVREMNFKKIFSIKVPTAIIPGIIAIPMAVMDFGVWALVASTLSGAFVNMILLWLSSNWRPKIVFDFAFLLKSAKFSSWVIGENFIGWLLVWGDIFILGKFLGLDDVGLYRNGLNICSLLFGLLLNPLLSVMYSTFSRLQNDKNKVKDLFLNINRIIVVISFLIGMCLFLFGAQFSEILFPDKWIGIGEVVRILGLTLGITSIIGINTEIYRATGKPDLNVKIMFVAALFYLPAYYISAQMGLHIFLYVRFSLGFIAMVIQMIIVSRVIQVPLLSIIKNNRAALFSSFFLIIGIMTVNFVLMPDNMQISPIIIYGIELIITVLFYILFIWIIDRPFFNYVIGQIRSIIRI